MNTSSKTNEQQIDNNKNLAQLSDADRKLHLQSTEAVRKLEERLGRPFDENSERMAAHVAYKAKEAGLTGVRAVELNGATGRLRAGENIIIVNDRYADEKVVSSTRDAISKSVEDSMREINGLGRNIDKKQDVNAPSVTYANPENTPGNPANEPRQQTLRQ
jgi:hypothetical protein